LRLRLQLTLVFGAFIAVILSAVAVSVYVLTERSLSVGITDQADRALAELTSGTSTIAQGVEKLPSDAHYQILLVGPAGRVPDSPSDFRGSVTWASNSGIVSSLPDSAVQSLLDTGQMTETVNVKGERLRVLGRLSTVNFTTGVPSVQAAFLVGIPASLMSQTLEQLARDLIATVLIAFIVFALGVWLLSERVLTPLKRVTAAAGLVSVSDLSNMLDRLQESFETQRRFTADASHELRTPVTAIGGHVSYLLRRTNPTSDQLDSLEVIQRESERMAKLVNDLLELARADAGFTVHLEPMNVVEVVEAVKQEVAPVAGAASIEVRSTTPLAEVMGDFTRLKQVLLNLVQNALNAGANKITIAVRPERTQVHIEVLDDGSGIPADALPHLFDRFYRVDGARSVRGNGSGLGLAIVNWIVQQHGGSVEVESRIGEGSVFTVTLPALDVRATSDLTANVRATLVDSVMTRVRNQPQ